MEVLHIKSFSQAFCVIFTGKQLSWGLLFNKVAGHQSCTFKLKRDSNIDILL